MLAQPFGRGRPEDQLGDGGEAGLRHPLYAPLLCQYRRDAQEPGRLRTLAGPFPRRKVVRIGSELDDQIARVHGAAIPLQPEAETALPHAVFGQGIRSEIVPLISHPVAPLARGPGFPPAEFLPRLLPRYLCQGRKEARDSSRMLDMREQPRFSPLLQVCYFVLYLCLRCHREWAEMQMVRCGEEAQPALTEMPTLPD